MNREALADRIVTYSDALAAFSIVNAFAFVVTLAEPDIRCSIARIAGAAIAANLVMSAFITAGLIGLRRFERRMRGDDAQDEAVEQFWRGVQAFRIALVWVVALLVCLGLWAATQDPSCLDAAPPG